MQTPTTILRSARTPLALFALLLGTLAAAQPAGPVTHWTFQGQIAGAPTQVLVSAELLPRLSVTPGVTNIWVGAVGQYFLLAGQVVNPYASYMFTAEISGGAAGFGDMVDLVSGERFRIRIDLTPQGFILSTNPFEGNCGEYGCAHYPFQLAAP